MYHSSQAHKFLLIGQNYNKENIFINETEICTHFFLGFRFIQENKAINMIYRVKQFKYTIITSVYNKQSMEKTEQLTSSYQCYKDIDKIDNQTPTETSSEIIGQWQSVSGSNKCQEVLQEENLNKKGQNKLKYRKLTQKLNNMGHQHEDKMLGGKEISCPNKQRIMKLANDFEKHMKSQNRDQYLMQAPLRELQRIVDIKSDQDLLFLRHSRLIPAIFQLIQKIPSLHKNQLIPSMRSLQIGLKILLNFSYLYTNREYLILTKRVKALITLTSWMLGRDEKKMLYYCFKIINILLLHRNKSTIKSYQQIETITNMTVQLIVCSSIFKKMKIIFDGLYCQGSIIDSELLFQMLKFINHILRKVRDNQRLNGDSSIIYKKDKYKLSVEQSQLLDFLVGFLSKFIINIREDIINDLKGDYLQNQIKSQSTVPIVNSSTTSVIIPTPSPTFTLSIQSYRQLPLCVLNTFFMCFKIINTCFELDFYLCKKSVDLDSMIPLIVQLTIHCKQAYDDSIMMDQKNLLNQIIIFIGYVALDEEINQKKIYQSGLLQQLCNLPIPFIMDSNLKDIITPTMCSLFHGNKTNINVFLKDNSPLSIIKYLKNQMQARPSHLSRKNSTQSLDLTLSTSFDPEIYISFEKQRLGLVNRFPQGYWEDLCFQLEKCAKMCE